VAVAVGPIHDAVPSFAAVLHIERNAPRQDQAALPLVPFRMRSCLDLLKRKC
jgi:hypothetical protein